MNWYEKCLLELTHHNMFESTEHRLRFRDLVSCYYTAPFFTKGLCKCMYLSSWDDVHFDEMLSMMNEMTIEGAQDLRIMSDQGVVRSNLLSGTDGEVYKLSTSFLTGMPYTLPDFTLLDPDGAHIIRQGLLAAKYIDELPDLHTA